MLHQKIKPELIRNRIVVSDGLLNFASNDYLGISRHPKIRRAFSKAAKKFGLGSGSSALISGYHAVHAELEQRFAEFLNRDRALLFNSGYHANIGALTALAGRSSHIWVDRLCHASIIDAIILSRAQYQRYTHHNLNQLNILLKISQAKHKLIVTESVFSMDGDISKIAELGHLARESQALLIIDDAHGLGILEEKIHQHDAPLLVAPLGKAFGSFGAMVAGESDLIETLLQFSRTYRYSTALPPAIAYATLAALTLIQQENWRRERLAQLIHFFVGEAQKRQLVLCAKSNTPIQPILIGDNTRTVQLQQKLLAKGILVAAIRPPTVPAGTARLRISLSCEHSEAQILYLLNTLSEHNREH